MGCSVHRRGTDPGWPATWWVSLGVAWAGGGASSADRGGFGCGRIGQGVAVAASLGCGWSSADEARVAGRTGQRWPAGWPGGVSMLLASLPVAPRSTGSRRLAGRPDPESLALGDAPSLPDGHPWVRGRWTCGSPALRPVPSGRATAHPGADPLGRLWVRPREAAPAARPGRGGVDRRVRAGPLALSGPGGTVDACSRARLSG